MFPAVAPGGRQVDRGSKLGVSTLGLEKAAFPVPNESHMYWV